VSVISARSFAGVNSISEEVDGSIFMVQVLPHTVIWSLVTSVTDKSMGSTSQSSQELALTVLSPCWRKPTVINDDDSNIDVRKIDCNNGPLWAMNLSAFAVVYDTS
jgi:hypothetical protein